MVLLLIVKHIEELIIKTNTFHPLSPLYLHNTCTLNYTFNLPLIMPSLGIVKLGTKSGFCVELMAVVF